MKKVIFPAIALMAVSGMSAQNKSMEDTVYSKNKLPLPVYKVDVSDADKTTYYVNPQTGDVRSFTIKSRVHKWMYQGLHSFNFKFLAEHPILWNIVMWVTMIGGTLVSLSGVLLSYKYLRRKYKRLTRKNCKKE